MPSPAFADIANQETALLKAFPKTIPLTRRRRRETALLGWARGGISRVPLYLVETGEPTELVDTFRCLKHSAWP
jgi:hypothetical protein